MNRQIKIATDIQTMLSACARLNSMSSFFFSLFELLLKSELMMQIQGFLCSKFTGKLTPLFNSPQFVAMYFITREIQHTHIYPKIQMKFIYIYIYMRLC
jgi:hypothetical protein